MCDVKGKVGSSFSGCWNLARVDVSITAAPIFVSIAATCRAAHCPSASFYYRQAHAIRAGMSGLFVKVEGTMLICHCKWKFSFVQPQKMCISDVCGRASLCARGVTLN